MCVCVCVAVGGTGMQTISELSFRNARVEPLKRRCVVAYTPRLHTKNAEQQLNRVVSPRRRLASQNKNSQRRNTGCRKPVSSSCIVTLLGLLRESVKRFVRHALARLLSLLSRSLSPSLCWRCTKSESRWPISVQQLHVLCPLGLCFGLAWRESCSVACLVLSIVYAFIARYVVYKLHKRSTSCDHNEDFRIETDFCEHKLTVYSTSLGIHRQWVLFRA